MDGTRIIHGNALDLPLEDSSVDLVVTSPPYFALRSYRDDGGHYDGQVGSEATPAEFLEALWAATWEMVRALKPSGSIWVNLGDSYSGSGGAGGDYDLGGLKAGQPKYAGTAKKQRADKPGFDNAYQSPTVTGVPRKSLYGLPWRYAIGCIDQLGLILRAEVIWSKPNGLPESVTDRVRRSHEQWFHFVKSPRYYSAVDEVREASGVPTVGCNPHGAHGEHYKLGSDGITTNGIGSHPTGVDGHLGFNPLGKLPGSVWTIPSEPLIIPEAVAAHYDLPDHFAAFPQEWPRRIILGWSPSGICIACGEGRRPVVEKERVGVSIRGTEGAQARGVEGLRSAGGYLDPGAETWQTTEATITGYVCACPEPDAPTTPAVVLDPFCGTGTTILVARALGRTGIGVELSKDYCRLAEWRVFHSGAGAKAERRTWAERQLGLL